MTDDILERLSRRIHSAKSQLGAVVRRKNSTGNEELDARLDLYVARLAKLAYEAQQATHTRTDTLLALAERVLTRERSRGEDDPA